MKIPVRVWLEIALLILSRLRDLWYDDDEPRQSNPVMPSSEGSDDVDSRIPP